MGNRRKEDTNMSPFFIPSDAYLPLQWLVFCAAYLEIFPMPRIWFVSPGASHVASAHICFSFCLASLPTSLALRLHILITIIHGHLNLTSVLVFQETSTEIKIEFIVEIRHVCPHCFIHCNKLLLNALGLSCQAIKLPI